MEKCSFFNAELVGESYDRVYLAEDYAKYFASFIGNGVFPNPATGLQVTADNTTMDVTIKKGKAWIDGYFYENTDNYTLKIDVADGVLNRIDRVVLRLDFLNREIKAYVKKGVFASNPTVPIITRDADMYEIALADVKVNRGAIKITQTDITDLRFNKELCGIVKGTVEVIDTTNLFAQFQDGFNTWFDNVKSQLGEDVAGSLQNQISEIIESKAEPNGIATLNEEGFIPSNQAPRPHEFFSKQKVMLANVIESSSSVDVKKITVSNNIRGTGMTHDDSYIYISVNGGLSSVQRISKVDIITGIEIKQYNFSTDLVIKKILVDDSKVYVAVAKNVYIFDKEFNVLKTFTTDFNVGGMTQDKDYIYFSDGATISSSSPIRRVSKTTLGETLSTNINGVKGSMTCDETNLYVVNFSSAGNGTILKYNKNTLVREGYSFLSYKGGSGLCVDNEYIYVSLEGDSSNSVPAFKKYKKVDLSLVSTAATVSSTFFTDLILSEEFLYGIRGKSLYEIDKKMLNTILIRDATTLIDYDSIAPELFLLADVNTIIYSTFRSYLALKGGV